MVRLVLILRQRRHRITIVTETIHLVRVRVLRAGWLMLTARGIAGHAFAVSFLTGTRIRAAKQEGNVRGVVSPSHRAIECVVSVGGS